MEDRCDFCGRFLNEQYYKLRPTSTYLLPPKKRGKRGIIGSLKNNIVLCPQCRSVKRFIKSPEDLIVALESGSVLKKRSKEHRAVMVKNILKLLSRFDPPKSKNNTPKKKNKKVEITYKRKVGVLNTIIGIKGYLKAIPGHPVYETEDRYVVYLRKEKPLTHDLYIETEIRYYKTSLEDKIKFDDH